MCIENGQVYELPNGNKLLAVVTEDGPDWLLPEVGRGDIYSVHGENDELVRYCGFGLSPFRSSQIVGTNWEETQYTVDDLQPVEVANISLNDVTAEELNKLPSLGGNTTKYPLH